MVKKRDSEITGRNSKSKKDIKDMRTKPSMGANSDYQGSSIVRIDADHSSPTRPNNQQEGSGSINAIRPPKLLRHIDTFKTDDGIPASPIPK